MLSRFDRRQMRGRYHLVTALAGVFMILGAMPGSASAFFQGGTQYVSPYNFGQYQSPVSSQVQQIEAQARYIEAVSAASVDFEKARKLRAEAVEHEIANSVAYVQAYWDKRAIGEAEKARRHRTRLQRQDKWDKLTLDRLHRHHGMSTAGIINGDALNFLLHRLANTWVAYDVSLGRDDFDPDVLRRYNLSQETIHDITLRENVPNGVGLVFQADSGEILQVHRWPFVLRNDEFQSDRDEFERIRQRAYMLSREGRLDGAALNSILKELMVSLDAIDAGLEAHYRREKKLNKLTLGLFQHRETAKTFIRSLAGEIGRIQETGEADSFQGAVRYEGESLFGLLKFMWRNGLEFAPAIPGKEPAYHTTYQMLLQLDKTVTDAEEDDDDKDDGKDDRNDNDDKDA